MNLFNECGEIGKGREIAMFWESSIEDFIKFCLSLFLHLGIADHLQKKVPIAEAVVSAPAEVLLH